MACSGGEGPTRSRREAEARRRRRCLNYAPAGPRNRGRSSRRAGVIPACFYAAVPAQPDVAPGVRSSRQSQPEPPYAGQHEGLIRSPRPSSGAASASQPRSRGAGFSWGRSWEASGVPAGKPEPQIEPRNRDILGPEGQNQRLNCHRIIYGNAGTHAQEHPTHRQKAPPENSRKRQKISLCQVPEAKPKAREEAGSLVLPTVLGR
jgi:hypothetical protein